SQIFASREEPPIPSLAGQLKMKWPTRENRRRSFLRNQLRRASAPCLANSRYDTPPASVVRCSEVGHPQLRRPVAAARRRPQDAPIVGAEHGQYVRPRSEGQSRFLARLDVHPV